MTEVVFQVIGAVLLLLGAFLVLGAGIGLLRMPDFLNRLHATSLASTLGVVLMSLGTAFEFTPTESAVEVWLLTAFVVFFFFVANPAVTHLLSRAALYLGVRHIGEDGRWKKKI